MVAVLLGSLVFSRWPDLPVDPRTIAGGMYYFARSTQLREDFLGKRFALMDEHSRQVNMEALDRRYVYVELHDDEKGTRRMAVEAVVLDNDGNN